MNQGDQVRIVNRRQGGLWWKIPLALLLWSLFAVPAVGSIVAIQFIRHHAEDLPLSPSLQHWAKRIPQTSVILAADDTIMAKIAFDDHGISGHRTFVSYAKIPPILVKTILVAEDLRFFQHEGIDPKAILRSAWANYRAGAIVQGASTITQQLARNIVPDIGKERSIRRKIREALLARRIEKEHTKEEIFSSYANFIFFGANAYGVAAAAHRYFSKDLAELNLPESALLAGLIQIPGRGNPYRHPVIAKERRNTILKRMWKLAWISDSIYEQSIQSPLGLHQPVEQYGSLAPWATEEVRRWLKQSFPRQYANGGLQVQTTIPPVAASQIEVLSHQYVEKIINEEKQLPQMAVLAYDFKSGYIEVMVGGHHWGESSFNRVTQSCRQPGSAFKPLVYGAALKANVITPATPLRDGPISEYDPRLEVYWKPTNAGREFKGIAIAQDAIASSLNTPAVDVFDRVGGEAVIRFATEMGIHSKLKNVRPLALGASCVNPKELTSAYAIIANDGMASPAFLVKRIVINQQGVLDHRVYFDAYTQGTQRLDLLVKSLTMEKERLLDKESAYQLRSMLRAVVKRGTGSLARSLDFPVAGKTGTTNGNVDAWFVGFSARIASSVWIGHDDPSRKLGRGHDGSHAALPLWKKMMKQIEHSRKLNREIPGQAPLRMKPLRIDRDTGLLAAPGSGGSELLYFKPGTEPSERAGQGMNAMRDLSRKSEEF